MAIDMEKLVAWMGNNCRYCEHLGDDMWIDVQCEIAQRIVWGGEPYNAEDTQLIASHINRGSCAKLEDERDKLARAKAILEKHNQARLRVRRKLRGIPEKSAE